MPVDSKSHRLFIGKPLYVAITRRNISLAVRKLENFMDKSQKVYWQAAMMVLMFSKSSPGMLLFFQKRSFDTEAYSKEDHANSIDDRESTTRRVFGALGEIQFHVTNNCGEVWCIIRI